VIAGVIAARASRDRVDVLLSLYLLVSAVSAIFATNPWLAARAVAISASSVVLFWAARGLRDAGLAAPLIRGLALAVIAAAVTSLLQTYGVDLIFFSEQRAPGGTLGNRNFVAHVAAFGFPILLLTALRAQRSFFWSAGAALVVASLVLTRSRAAWLAFGAVMVVFFVGLLRQRDARTWRRLGGIVVLAAIAVAAALLIPNALRWRSDNPYLETMRRVADYQGGSGRGRLVQYERSLRMAAHHPLLGVGPGNWSVRYPEFATRNDPSMNDSEAGMTFNPWPSSDWIANVAERGLAATILLALVFVILGWRALRGEDALESGTLLATIAGVLVAGMFDAVLLLAVPAFLVWTALGVLSRSAVASATALGPEARASGSRSRAVARATALLGVLLALVGVARSASQLIAMQINATRSDRVSLSNAAVIDPANYRLQLRLARGGQRKERCVHARIAHSLYPNALAARALMRACGE